MKARQVSCIFEQYLIAWNSWVHAAGNFITKDSGKLVTICRYHRYYINKKGSKRRKDHAVMQYRAPYQMPSVPMISHY